MYSSYDENRPKKLIKIKPKDSLRKTAVAPPGQCINSHFFYSTFIQFIFMNKHYILYCYTAETI